MIEEILEDKIKSVDEVLVEGIKIEMNKDVDNILFFNLDFEIEFLVLGINVMLLDEELYFSCVLDLNI